MEQANQEIQHVNNQPNTEAEQLDMPQDGPIDMVLEERSVAQSSRNRHDVSLDSIDTVQPQNLNKSELIALAHNLKKEEPDEPNTVQPQNLNKSELIALAHNLKKEEPDEPKADEVKVEELGELLAAPVNEPAPESAATQTVTSFDLPSVSGFTFPSYLTPYVFRNLDLSESDMQWQPTEQYLYPRISWDYVPIPNRVYLRSDEYIYGCKREFLSSADGPVAAVKIESEDPPLEASTSVLMGESSAESAAVHTTNYDLPSTSDFRSLSYLPGDDYVYGCSEELGTPAVGATDTVKIEPEIPPLEEPAAGLLQLPVNYDLPSTSGYRVSSYVPTIAFQNPERNDLNKMWQSVKSSPSPHNAWNYPPLQNTQQTGNDYIYDTTPEFAALLDESQVPMKIEPEDPPLEGQSTDLLGESSLSELEAGSANDYLATAIGGEFQFGDDQRPFHFPIQPFENAANSLPLDRQMQISNFWQSALRACSFHIPLAYPPLPNRMYVPNDDYINDRMPMNAYGTPPTAQTTNPGEVIKVYGSDSSSGTDSNSSWVKERRLHKKQVLKRFIESTAIAGTMKFAKSGSGEAEAKCSTKKEPKSDDSD